MSFHTNYQKWLSQCDKNNCKVCNAAPMIEGMIDLYELNHSWLNSEIVDCMKYACHVTSKYHGIELFDLTDQELLGIMKDVAIYAKALKIVTKAIKINYEIHGNTTPHLHIHLYPRFLNDPFAAKAIDYSIKINQYENNEYDDFVKKMREELDRLTKNDLK